MTDHLADARFRANAECTGRFVANKVSAQLTDLITANIMAKLLGEPGPYARLHANDEDATGRSHDSLGRFAPKGDGSRSTGSRSVALGTDDAIRRLVSDAHKTEYGSGCRLPLGPRSWCKSSRSSPGPRASSQATGAQDRSHSRALVSARPQALRWAEPTAPAAR